MRTILFLTVAKRVYPELSGFTSVHIIGGDLLSEHSISSQNTSSDSSIANYLQVLIGFFVGKICTFNFETSRMLQ